MKIKVAIAIAKGVFLAAAASSCATTTFYCDGKPVARFQGDMVGMAFERHADGSVVWSGNVTHSIATKAQGEAASAKLTAAGIAVATSGLVSTIK